MDDALDLLDVLITNKLLARAERESAKQKIRAFPKLGRASITMAAAVNVLLEITAAGEEVAARAEHDGIAVEPVGLAQLWVQIETVASRAELTRAMTDIVDLAGPADDDADAAWRVELVKRYQTVRPFLPMLCQVIRFGASPEGAPVLAALRDLPRLWGGGRNKVGVEEIDQALLIGSWKRLVLASPDVEPGSVDWRAWTFCVLEQFHRRLRHRDIFAVKACDEDRNRILNGPSIRGAEGPWAPTY